MCTAAVTRGTNALGLGYAFALKRTCVQGSREPMPRAWGFVVTLSCSIHKIELFFNSIDRMHVFVELFFRRKKWHFSHLMARRG